MSRVDARAGAVTLVDDDAGASRVFVIRIDEVDGRFSGEVAIIADDGETRRVVTTADCGELVEALALITVLAVDPDEAVVEAPAAEPPRSWRFAVGAGASGAVGVAPGALPALPVFAEVDHRELGRLRVSGRWGRRTAGVGDGSARFDWTRLQIDGCPARATIDLRAAVIGACAGIQIGILRGRGAEIEGARTASRPWVAPELAGSLRRSLSTRWFAELETVVAVPLVRDHFYFMPDATIHRVPPVVFEVAIALGVSIP